MATDAPPDLDPVTAFAPYQDAVFSDVMSTVKSASALAAVDLDFQRSMDPSFAAAIEKTQARILALTNSLLKSAAAGSDVAAPRLDDEDDVENKWPQVVDIADFLLERADTCLDEFTGAIKQKYPEAGPNARVQKDNKVLSRREVKRQNFKAHSWGNRNMPKPQLEFDVKPDNMATGPFKPLLRTKPHAKVPLEESIRVVKDEQTGEEHYDHPYKTEIETMEYPAHMFEVKGPIGYKPLEETEAIWVDDKETLEEMLEELKKAKEIAVDLEHHDTRSYIGFVCLMQISTRDKDWIVDTLKLRSELQILNEVFADPKIIKVLHGAFMDIIWLQRDFGLYVVGLFDTYYASKILGLSGHSLAFLLKHYVDFDADKQYQLADWRMRPLPEEMLAYARSDTHFLLYVFDHLRNALLENPSTEQYDDKMSYTLTHSRETALRQYEREHYDLAAGTGSYGWRAALGKTNTGLTVEQLAVFKAVHHWRDTVARQEDEGHHYVLPKYQLFKLARDMPEDPQSLFASCAPVTVLVRQRASELLAAIKAAKNSPEVLAWREQVAKDAAAAATAPAQTHTRFEPPPQELFAPAPDLRAAESRFWGGAASSSLWAPPLKSLDVRLAVPIPELTAEVFVQPGAPEEKKTLDPGARAEHEYVRNREKKEESDVMVVRQVGGGRKRKLVAGSPTPEERERDAVESPLETPEKKQKKKKGKESGEGEGEGEGDGEGEEEGEKEKQEFKPFDYSAAPSVLHGNKDMKDPTREKRKKKKKPAFDPYKEADEKAVRGMSRGQHERAGRARTFK